MDPRSSGATPAPIAERSNSSDFITRGFRQRLQRAAAALQRSRPNPPPYSSRTAPSANSQSIPPQQQHRPVFSNSADAREYVNQSQLTGRVLRHTVRDSAEIHNDSTDCQEVFETETMEVRIECQGPDRWLYWRLYTETVTTKRTTHFVDNGIEPVVN